MSENSEFVSEVTTRFENIFNLIENSNNYSVFVAEVDRRFSDIIKRFETSPEGNNGKFRNSTIFSELLQMRNQMKIQYKKSKTFQDKVQYKLVCRALEKIILCDKKFDSYRDRSRCFANVLRKYIKRLTKKSESARLSYIVTRNVKYNKQREAILSVIETFRELLHRQKPIRNCLC